MNLGYLMNIGYFAISEKQYLEVMNKGFSEKIDYGLLDKEGKVILEKEKALDCLRVSFEYLFACLNLMYEVGDVRRQINPKNDIICFEFDSLMNHLLHGESFQIIKSKEKELVYKKIK